MARCGETPKYAAAQGTLVSKVYYVTMDGDRVEGPYDTRSEAKAVADDLNTHEVLMEYRVEGVPED